MGLWLAAAGASAPAQSVSLELKTGDRLIGQILSETTNQVVLSNAWSREWNIPVAEIVKRTPLPPAASLIAVTNETGAVVKGNPPVLAGAATNAPFFTAPIMRHWHGDVLVGTDLTFSERNRQIYNARAKLIYARERFKAVIEYDASYGRSQFQETVYVDGKPTTQETTQTEANRMTGALKLDYDLTKKTYVYNLGSIGYDEIRKIDLRYQTGPGVGYRVVQQPNFTANVELGMSYLKEIETDGTDTDNFFFRFAENVVWKITPRLSWDEQFEFMPRVEGGEFQMRFGSNLRYTLVQNLFVNLSVVDIYDSTPAVGVPPNDLQFRSSVGLKF